MQLVKWLVLVLTYGLLTLLTEASLSFAMSTMVCQKCRLQLPLPPHSLLFRCECGNLIPLGNSERSLPVQEHGRFSSKLRRFRDKFRTRSSRKNSPSPSPSVSPRLSLIFTKPPPSGKRALLCGVTYKKEKFRLRGTLHDVHSMKDLLVQKFNFSDDAILILAGNSGFTIDIQSEANSWF